MLVIAAVRVGAVVGDNVELAREPVLAAVYVTLASNLNMVLGYAGYVNFGSIVFFGLGGYICVYLMSAPGWPLPRRAVRRGRGGELLSLRVRARDPAPARRLFRARDHRRQRGGEAFVHEFRALGRLGRPLSARSTLFAPLGGPMQALWMIYFLLVAVMGLSLVSELRYQALEIRAGPAGDRPERGRGAQCSGVPTPRYKALVYSVSAFLPAIAGGLYFFKSAFIQPPDAFDLTFSIEAIVIVMLGGQGTVVGPGHRRLFLYEELRGWLLTSRHFRDFQLVIAGALLLVIVLFAPGGLMGWHLRTLAASQDGAGMTALLEVDGLEQALRRRARRASGLSFTISEGEILGLIGPNGAGKSTLFNLINGVIAPDAGRIKFRGADITGARP